MHIRSFPLLIALAVLAALLLAPAAFAAGAVGVPGIMDWTAILFTVPTGDADNAYGQSVAVDGDIAVVGAPGTTVDAQPAQGAAFVYVREDGQWVFETTLTADDGEAGDEFGASVAIDDGIIAVGAPMAVEGAVYVYTQAGEGWGLVDELHVPVVRARSGDIVGDRAYGFGYSVSVKSTAVAVGYPDAYPCGVAFVYAWDSEDGEYDLWAMLDEDEPVERQHFGSSVAFNTGSDSWELAVGGPGDRDIPGIVCLFDAPSDHWSLYQTITQPTPVDAVGTTQPENDFGRSVSLRGDVLAVGSPMVAVGAEAADDAVGFDALPGAAYVFYRDEGMWSDVGTLTPETPEYADGFGMSVDVATDFGVFVGAPGRDVDDDQDQGAVYAYDWTGTIYTGPYELVEGSGGANDWFGFSLDVSQGQVFAGAPGATIGDNIAQGAAWMYTLPAPDAKVLGYSPRWVRAPMRLNFRPIDATGGAFAGDAQYCLGTGSWKDGTLVTVRRQGATRVQFRAVDIFGTPGVTKSVIVRIDTRRPTVIAKAATAKAGSIARMAYKVSDPRPSSGTAFVRVVVSNAAGVPVTRAATIPVSTNAWHTVRIKALRLTPGVYRVQLHAIDRAGNAQNGWTTTTLTVN